MGTAASNYVNWVEDRLMGPGAVSESDALPAGAEEPDNSAPETMPPGN